jgi:hypothetical protein
MGVAVVDNDRLVITGETQTSDEGGSDASAAEENDGFHIGTLM